MRPSLRVKVLAAAVLVTISLQAPAQSLPAPPVSPAPVVQYDYDLEGHVIAVTQAPGVAGYGWSTVNTFDSLGRLKDSTDPTGTGKIVFGRDGLDRPLRLTDPRGLLTQSPRNGLGDPTQLISPDTGTASSTFDAAGQLKTRTDSRGVLSTTTYDVLNRPSAIVYSQSGQASRTYSWAYDQTGTGFSNGIGRLTSSSFPDGSLQYAYDGQGRITTATQRVLATSGANATTLTQTTGYAYDGVGHVSAITYPSGSIVSFTYSQGLLNAIGVQANAGATGQPLLSQIHWQPFGPADHWLWQMVSGTQSHDRVYDTSGRSVRYPLAGFVRDLSYDPANRISGYSHRDAATGTATAAAVALNQNFAYDKLDRLTNVTTNASSWTIAYDANGNRTGVTLNGVARTYTTPTTSNRLSSVSNPARSLGYDAAGNMSSDTGLGYTATYNLENRLQTVTRAGQTATFSYNSLGQRVRKFNSSGAASTVLFVFDVNTGHLLGEYDATGKAVKEYVWLGDTLVALMTPDPASASNPPLIYYVQTDHLNTPRAVLDKNNKIRWRWLAEPFGVTAPETNPSGLGAFTLNLRFPGQYYDTETGLAYNYFRDYDSTTGRYVQSDPIGLDGGINTYGYVGGNPMRYTDPMGLQIVIIVGGSGRQSAGLTGTPIDGFLPSGGFGNQIFNKPPKDAEDPNGAKAPGKPGDTEGFCEPKKGKPKWGRAPNGRGAGWIDGDGNVWVPTGPDGGSTGDAHGGPHWDVQSPGGGYENVYPGGKRR
jgi:RHS repeat-associated protein